MSIKITHLPTGKTWHRDTSEESTDLLDQLDPEHEDRQDYLAEVNY